MNSTIQNLRIPLTLLVIFAHASASWAPAQIFSRLGGHLAVATFFVISGYLLFLKSQDYSLKIYRRKLQSRLKTLLVPYLIWVLFYLLFKSYGMHRTVWELWSDYGGLNVFWRAIPVVGGTTPLGFDNTSYGPFYGPFWYVEHLMLLVILSPLLFVLLRYCGKMTLAILLLLYLSGIGIPYSPMQFFSVLYFCFGCYLSLNRLPLYMGRTSVRYLFYGASLLLLALLACEEYLPATGVWFVGQLLIPVGVLSLMNLFSGWSINSSFINLLIPCSFFVYAAHMYVVPYTYSDRISWIWEDCPVMEFVFFVLRPFFVFLFLSGIYYLAKRFTPRLLSALTGER